MKSDDILVIMALGGLGYVLYTRIKKAAPAAATASPAMPFNAAVPVGQMPTGSPYNPATVGGWLALIKQVKDLAVPIGSFEGHDYVGDTDSAPSLIEASNQAASHDSIWTGAAQPEWAY